MVVTAQASNYMADINYIYKKSLAEKHLFLFIQVNAFLKIDHFTDDGKFSIFG